MNRFRPWLVFLLMAICNVSIAKRIEAESFIEYYDTTPGNTGGDYRDTDVDINQHARASGYYVGWIAEGEYLRYSLSVPETGIYRFRFRVAAIASGKHFHMELNGSPVGERINVPKRSGWHDFTTVESDAVLVQGDHILTLAFDSDEFNVDFFEFELIQAVETQSIPGLIEAENYSDAYDTTPGNTGGEYRQGDVDIERALDQQGGYNVGWTAAGEYLVFPVTVESSGVYRVDFRVATTKNNRKLSLLLDESTLLSEETLPNTGGWQKWQTHSAEVNLPEGQHSLKVRFDTREINLNYLEFQVKDANSDDWVLVWQDEFNGSQINQQHWTLANNAWGGGNNELQYYTPRAENAYVSDGKLIIRALKERFTGAEGTRDYTSARLDSKHKADFLYGRFEIRARLPHGQGIWPAIWMLPTDDVYGGWAASGEIDIMEAVNLGVNGNNDVHGTLHYGGSWPNNTHSGEHYTLPRNGAQHFHTYAIEWEPGEIRWYVDNVHYATQTQWWTANGDYPAPFDQPFHLILNVAVGGNWPGSPDHTTQFPQTMEVDFVRVYQKGASRQAMLNVQPSDQGRITSHDGAIDCGDHCQFNIDRAQQITLQAMPANGFQFVEWMGNNACAGNASDTCTLSLSPDSGIVEIAAHYSEVGGCGDSQAYHGTPVNLPGRIEAENYDKGCAGYAYFDIDPENQGGAYRNDEVDIEVAHDQGGGYNIGWLRDGEWLNYKVNVAETGYYDVAFRVASKGNGSALSLQMNDNFVLNSYRFSATGSWQNWKTVTARRVYMEQGVQNLTLWIDDGDFNLNYMQVFPSGGQSDPLIADSSRGEWTLVVIPDTQHYTQNRSNAPIAHMRDAFQWIVDIKDQLNIQFVQGLGDITESGDNTWEWDNAYSAWRKLEGQVAHIPVKGNHDRSYKMNQYFPVSRFEQYPWWGGHFKGIQNSYAYKRINSEDYLFLQIRNYDQYSPYRQDVMDWANSIVAQHPHHKVILATHDNWATRHVRDKLLVNHDNIVLTNAGHDCQREARFETFGPNGGRTMNFITDYQCDANEVMLIRFYKFKPLEDKVEYFTYSPITEQFEIDDSSQGEFSLQQN